MSEVIDSNLAPKGSRLLISLIGRRNVGKSSLLNALTGQEVSIVSSVSGTTTDAVVKHYELLPFGPVSFYDTAGIDDEGVLGDKRKLATQKVLWRTDLALLITDGFVLSRDEEEVIRQLKRLNIPYIRVFNKVDKLAGKRILGGIDIYVSALTGEGIKGLKELIIKRIPDKFKYKRGLLEGLIRPRDIVSCITPQDLSAPVGRLILPQVQVIREIIDKGAYALVSQEMTEEILKHKPSLVITDSQVVKEVSLRVKGKAALTTFSIIFSRYKGELSSFVKGVEQIKELRAGDEVLISEACSHHVQGDDIGRVKIPSLLRDFTGFDLKFSFISGHDFPVDLEKYRLVIHCGGCMLGHIEMLRRIKECERRGVSITNYGMIISKVSGVLDIVLDPFKGEF